MSVLNLSGDDAVECPLCMEPLEVDDLNFFPCTCGYQICRFCWHRIRTDENGLCPACRKAYSENPADFKPLTKEEISRLKAEKRLKDQQRKQRVTENRKHLANVRVVQKNLVFVVGLPMRLAEADVLKRHEYFGKFGKIHKVVINQSTSYAGSQGPSASAYVTYQRQEDALRAIEAVNNIVVDGRTIKTSLGTTKYCSHFMRNQACPKSDCMYLHDLGDQEASFTKEEMHQGKHQDYERKLVQALHAQTTTPLNRKPTISPPVGNSIRENGSTSVIPTQIKEAWPSLQPGQPQQSVTLTKDTSAQVLDQQQQQQQQQSQHQQQSQSNDMSINKNSKSVPSNSNGTSQQNNNNKGESGIITTEKGSNSRRGKSNSESKAQAARNKHKNNQNKEKHGAGNVTRTTSRSESSNSSNSNSNGANTTQSHTIEHSQQINGQKFLKNYNSDMINGQQQQTSRCKKNNGEQQINYKDKDIDNDNDNDNESENDQREINNVSETTKELEQSMCEIKLNGIENGIGGNSCGNSESESELLREGSTPASTASSSSTSDDLGLLNTSTDRLIVDANVSDDNDESDLIRDPSPINGTNLNLSTSTSQVVPPGFYNSNNHINSNINVNNHNNNNN
ncbi:GSCOCG00000533001-RA-CDS, partial [Cotesia congregata]